MGRQKLSDEQKAANKAAKQAVKQGAPAAVSQPAGSGGKSIWKFEAPQASLTVHLRDGRVCNFNAHIFQTDRADVAEAIKQQAKGVRLIEVFSMDNAGNVSKRGKRASDTPWKVVPLAEEWDMETRRGEYGTKAEAEAFIASLGSEAEHYAVEFIEG